MEDDGVGFDVTAAEREGEGAARQSGLGLAGMRERIAAVDGDMTIGSRPGGGTTVRVRIPTEPRRILNG